MKAYRFKKYGQYKTPDYPHGCRCAICRRRKRYGRHNPRATANLALKHDFTQYGYGVRK